MKTYQKLESIVELKDKWLFLDNSSLIAIVSHEELFTQILSLLSENNVALTIIPPILFEFTRTDSISAYNKRVNFIKNNLHADNFPVEKYIQSFKDLTLVLQKTNGKISYPDFLLYCSLYKFSGKAFLLTENHKDFTLAILDRVDVITIDNDSSQIRNLGIYAFSMDKYEKAARSILSALDQ